MRVITNLNLFSSLFFFSGRQREIILLLRGTDILRGVAMETPNFKKPNESGRERERERERELLRGENGAFGASAVVFYLFS